MKFYASIAAGVQRRRYMFLPVFLPPTKEDRVHVCARVRLSVCLLARFLKNVSMDLDIMLRVDRCRDMDELINF